MNESRSSSKFDPRLGFIIVLLFLLGLLAWSVFETRQTLLTASEHSQLQDVDQKQIQQLKDSESWGEQRLQAARDDVAEYRILPKLHKACFSKEDFFPLHPGEYCAYAFGRPTDPIRKKWFYLPPGEHKLHISVVRADSVAGRTPQITDANFRAKAEKGQAEILSEHKFELQGGKVHEFEVKREVQDEGGVVVASLNGKVLEATGTGSPRDGTSISTSFDPLDKLPHRIHRFKLKNWDFFPSEPQDADTWEIEFVVNRFRLAPQPMKLFNVHCSPAYIYCFATLEFGGQPRANFVDGSWEHKFSLFGPPFLEERWFDYRDGLYFLKKEVKFKYE